MGFTGKGPRKGGGVRIAVLGKGNGTGLRGAEERALQSCKSQQRAAPGGIRKLGLGKKLWDIGLSK